MLGLITFLGVIVFFIVMWYILRPVQPKEEDKPPILGTTPVRQGIIAALRIFLG